MLECVIRVCKDYNQNILWSAIYIDGKLDTELEYFNPEKLAKAYGYDVYYVDTVFDNDFEESKDFLFPQEEDFSYLLDERLIQEGDLVFLKDGIHIVEEIIFNDTEYKVKVKGDNKYYDWGYYGYIQSDLYNKYKKELHHKDI